MCFKKSIFFLPVFSLFYIQTLSSAPLNNPLCKRILRAVGTETHKFFGMPLYFTPQQKPQLFPIERAFQTNGNSNIFVPDAPITPTTAVLMSSGSDYFFHDFFVDAPLIPAPLSRTIIRQSKDSQNSNPQTLRTLISAHNAAEKDNFSQLAHELDAQKYSSAEELIQSRELIPEGSTIHLCGINSNHEELFLFLNGRKDLKKIYISEPNFFYFYDGKMEFDSSLVPILQKRGGRAFKQISEVVFQYKNIILEFVFSANQIPTGVVDFAFANHPNEALKGIETQSTLSAMKVGSIFWIIEADNVIYAPFNIMREVSAKAFNLMPYGSLISDPAPNSGYGSAIRSTLFRIHGKAMGAWDDIQWASESGLFDS